MTAREVLEVHFPGHGMHSIARHKISARRVKIDCSCGELLEIELGNKAHELAVREGLKNAPSSK